MTGRIPLVHSQTQFSTKWKSSKLYLGGIHGRQTIEEKRWHAHLPCIAGLSIFLVCVTRISNNLFVWHYIIAGYLGLNSHADWHVLIDLQYNNGHRSVLIFLVQRSWQPQLAPVQQVFRWIESREVSCRSGNIYSPPYRHTKSNTMETYLLVYWARQVASINARHAWTPSGISAPNFSTWFISSAYVATQ